MKAQLTSMLNSAADAWAAWMWPMAWHVTVLVLVVAALAWLLRDRSARLRYALWLLIPMRLLLPPTLALATGWGWWLLPTSDAPAVSLMATEPLATHHGPELETGPKNSIQPERFDRSEGLAAVTANSRSNNPLATEPPQPIATVAISLRGWLLCGWLFGAGILAIRLLHGCLYAAKMVRRAEDISLAHGDRQQEAANANGLGIAELLESCRLRMGIPRTVRLCQMPDAGVPMLIGFVRPTIILSTGLDKQLTSQELEAVLVHELQHVARHDAVVHLLQSLLGVIYFFHPLVWLANRLLNDLREDACDEGTVAVLEGQRRDYGVGIVKIAEMISGHAPTMSLGIVESGGRVKRRLQRILDPRLPVGRGLSWSAFALLMVLAAVMLPVAARPSYSASPKPSEPTAATLTGVSSDGDQAAEDEATTADTATADAKAAVAPEQATVGPGDEIAKIEALGGTVTRDQGQPGSPVTSVNLSGTNVKDDDLRLLSHFSSLRELCLIGTDITDAGLKSLVGLQNLEELRAGNCRISDAGLKDLAKLKNLKMVGLIGTQVTDAGVKEFSAALPNMRHNLGAGGDGGGGGGQRSDPDFDITVAQPAYPDKHPAVLFDEAHRNFHTASGRYKPFADLITNDGYQVVPGTEPFTSEKLANYQILIIANAMLGRRDSNSAFTKEECDAVENWVKAGGSLLLVTDFEPWGSPSNELGKRFGVDMSLRVTDDPASETGNGLLFSRDKNQIGNHPIMNGRDDSEQVDRVLTWVGQSLKGPPRSTALLKFADTAIEQDDGGGTISAAGRNQGLALEYGNGRVVVMGEAAQLSAQVIGTSPERYGMNAPGCDNRKMALNLMHWLSNLEN